MYGTKADMQLAVKEFLENELSEKKLLASSEGENVMILDVFVDYRRNFVGDGTPFPVPSLRPPEVRITTKVMVVNNIIDIEDKITKIDSIYETFHSRLRTERFTSTELTRMPPNVRLSKDNLTDRGDLVINYIEDNFTVFSMKLLYNYNLYTDVYNNVSNILNMLGEDSLLALVAIIIILGYLKKD